MNALPTDRWLALVSKGSLLLLPCVVLLCFWQRGRLVESRFWVEHTDQVIREIRGVLAVSQTSGSVHQSGDTSSQGLPSPASQSVILRHVTTLRSLVADNPIQVQRCDRLASLIHEGPVATVQDSGQPKLITTGNQMIDAENALWRVRAATRDQHLYTMELAMAGAGALCLELAATGTLLKRRQQCAT